MNTNEIQSQVNDAKNSINAQAGKVGFSAPDIQAINSVIDGHIREISKGILDRKLTETALTSYKNNIIQFLSQKQEISRVIIGLNAAKESVKLNTKIATESLIIGSVRSAVQWTTGFDKNDHSKNSAPLNFFMGAFDSMLQMPEFVELLLENAEFRNQVVNALKNLNWQTIKQQIIDMVDDIAHGDAYEKGRSGTDLIFTLTGIAGIAKGFGKVLVKGGANIAMDGARIASKTTASTAEKIIGNSLKVTGKVTGTAGKTLKGAGAVMDAPMAVVKGTVNGTRKVSGKIIHSKPVQAATDAIKSHPKVVTATDALDTAKNSIKNTVNSTANTAKQTVSKATNKVTTPVKNKISSLQANKTNKLQNSLDDVNSNLSQNQLLRKNLGQEINTTKKNLKSVTDDIKIHEQLKDLKLKEKELSDLKVKIQNTQNPTLKRIQQDRITMLEAEVQNLNSITAPTRDLKLLKAEQKKLQKTLDYKLSQGKKLRTTQKDLTAKQQKLDTTLQKRNAPQASQNFVGPQLPNTPSSLRQKFDNWRNNSKAANQELKQLKTDKRDLEKALSDLDTELKKTTDTATKIRINQDIIDVKSALTSVDSDIIARTSVLKKTLIASFPYLASSAVVLNRITEDFDIDKVDPDWEKKVFEAPQSYQAPTIQGNSMNDPINGAATLRTMSTNANIVPSSYPPSPDSDAGMNILNSQYANDAIAMDFNKKSEARRQRISESWKKGPEWTNAIATMNSLDGTYNNLPSFALVKQWVDTVNNTPTPQNVNSLQTLLNMENSDSAAGRDGMLGPKTTAALMQYFDTIAPNTPENQPENTAVNTTADRERTTNINNQANGDNGNIGSDVLIEDSSTSSSDNTNNSTDTTSAIDTVQQSNSIEGMEEFSGELKALQQEFRTLNIQASEDGNILTLIEFFTSYPNVTPTQIMSVKSSFNHEVFASMGVINTNSTVDRELVSALKLWIQELKKSQQ